MDNYFLFHYQKDIIHNVHILLKTLADRWNLLIMENLSKQGEKNMKAGKIWGQTELIHANGVLEFHRIEYKAGYKCSEHEHQFKWNGFYVESGKMIVRVWQDDQDGLVDETILEAGDFTQVKPGKIHQFEGLEDGVAFELYWAEFNHNDIVRRTVGTKVKK